MKTFNVFPILMVVVLFCVGQHRAGAQYHIQHGVFGNGGAVISNENFSISSTAGQPITGVAGDSSYESHAGFWYLSCDYVTGIDQMFSSLPTEYWLGQNYPNPFNPTTTIQFGLPRMSHTSMTLFDILGREVMVLVDRPLNAGVHKVILNAHDFSSGVYFYRIRSDHFIQTKRLVLLR